LVNGVVRAARDVITSIVVSIAKVAAHTDRDMAVRTIRSINEDSARRLDAARGNSRPAES